MDNDGPVLFTGEGNTLILFRFFEVMTGQQNVKVTYNNRNEVHTF